MQPAPVTTLQSASDPAMSVSNWICAQVLTRSNSLPGCPLIMTGLVPFGRQKPSDSSQLLAVGHETGPVGPSVLEFLQTPVVRLQGPSPVLRLPSWPPPQVWK